MDARGNLFGTALEAKAELFEHLQAAVERSIWELYTLCEYDANPHRTLKASEQLTLAADDFAKVRPLACRHLLCPDC